MPSKFFRSASSDSTSSSGSSSSSDGDDLEASNLNADQSQSGERTIDLTRSISGLSLPAQRTDSNLHSQFLLHALLEERCLNAVRAEHQERWSEGDIQAEASRRYQALCAQLAPHNLISSGLEHDHMTSTRQRYRDGLDLLSRGSVSAAAGAHVGVPAPLRRLLTGPESSNAASLPDLQTWQMPHRLLDSGPGFASLAPAHPVLEASRYLRDFEEVCLLGRGGYGMVYQVRHRLDDAPYAIKKVPISPARMSRIQARGQRELDDLLRELRVMARLDHPNVVRYFAGWIEWADDSSTAAMPSDAIFSDGSRTGNVHSASTEDAIGGAEDTSSASLDRVVTQSDSETHDIIFETSAPSSDTHRSTRAAPLSPSIDDESSILNNSSSNIHDLIPSTRSTLALHLQMGLYPLTLANFLSPPRSSLQSVTPPLAHCFHLEPSLSIMLALLDGIEYLHAQGIVHRDLKPANVFLEGQPNPRTAAARGSVDLFLCSACRAANGANTIKLNVRIGDFGLVTMLAQPEGEVAVGSSSSGREGTAAVGTALYRPLHAASDASASLDLFALGVVFFELLWRFGTRMERHDTLQRLKEGYFPPDFSHKIGDGEGFVQGCIRDMLAAGNRDGTTELTVAELKSRLWAIEDGIKQKGMVLS